MKAINLYISLLGLVLYQNASAGIYSLKNVPTKTFLLSTAKTGCMPKGIKVDPAGRYLFVAEMCGKIDPVSKMRVPTASIFNMESKNLTQTLITPVGIKKDGILANTEVEFSFDKKWAMITRAEGDSKSEIFKNQALLTVVNNETHKIAKYIPLRGSGAKIIAARPILSDDPAKKQIVYVANYFSDDLSIVDISDLKEDGNLDGTAYFKKRLQLVTNFEIPGPYGYTIAPRGIAFTPDGKYALILATETGSLIIVDSVKHQQIAELAPIDKTTAGRELNLRHIVVSSNGQRAYLSHMRGNAISRLNMVKLIDTIKKLPHTGSDVTLPSSLWNELLIPFKKSFISESRVMVLEDYPFDHPNFPNKKWSLAHPNTIVLDPVKNRYLYVSHRTTTSKDNSTVNPNMMGKIDIIDLEKDRLVYSLVGGAQPTGLDISKDGKTLVSSGIINDKLYFFDVGKIIELYER